MDRRASAGVPLTPHSLERGSSFLEEEEEGKMKFTQLRDALNRPTDPKLIRRRRQGNVELDYLEWFTVNKLLNAHCPGWSGEASVTIAGDTIVVTYRISIPTEDGTVSRSATGSEKLSAGFDPVASAEQQAFKRAAARFGIGLDLYEK